MNGETANVLTGFRVRTGAAVATVVAAIMVVFVLLGSEPAYAASYVVDTTSDSNLTACTGAAGDCSLRGAMNNAAGNAGADTITFDAAIDDNSVTTPSGGDDSQELSVVLDTSGYPVISFYDFVNTDLEVLHCGNEDCTAGNSVTSPDTTGDVGGASSIKLDGSGFPVVSYYDSTNGDLKVLDCGNANCTAGNVIAAPDTAGQVGHFTSLALDSAGFPVVSYYDLTNGDLKLLHCGNATCTAGNSIASPDTGGDVGRYTSLRLDATGNPVITYQDFTNLDLKVLHCGNANCTSGNSTTAPDTGGTVGGFSSVELDASGFPVVSYYDLTNGDLKVLHCGNANCTSGNSITSPDTGGIVGAYTSLELDSFGYPVVSYYDQTNGDLKVLRCGDANCSYADTPTSPDTIGSVGLYTSLALGAAGVPVVAYSQSGVATDLKVLRCGNLACSTSGGVAGIGLVSGLPPLSNDGDTIDATASGVAIDGVTDTFDCFSVSGDNNVIVGLEFVAHCDVGIRITGSGNTVGGENIFDGDCSNPADNDSDGYANDGCPLSGSTAESGAQCSNTVNDDPGDDGSINDGCPARGQGITISGHDRRGVQITGASATGNEVLGNYIGTGTDGQAAVPNGDEGVLIDLAASANFVGGTAEGERNVISGNTASGISITGGTSINNTVIGNFVGTNAAGTAAVANGGSGVNLTSGTDGNTIGGSGALQVISGNVTNGVRIAGSGTTSNTIKGNHIGVNAAGTGAIANAGNGIGVLDGPNTIGGPTAADRNVISGNAFVGVYLQAGTGNVVEGNYIGTNAAGTGAVANGSHGVVVDDDLNTIGGTTAGERNVISGNTIDGVVINGSGTTLSGNYIGTNAGGAAALANGDDGVSLGSPATANIIGGSTGGSGNVISGNGGAGVDIGGATTSGNFVQGNHIGTNAAGTSAIANAANGVYIHTSANGNTIGGTTAGHRNVISGNGTYGIELSGSGASSNMVIGNYIGTNAAGTASVLNPTGILISNAENNTIGGTTTGERNVISGNGSYGVLIDGATASGNQVRGNHIGVNAAGTAALQNAIGVYIASGADSNTVGGSTTTPGTPPGNVISGNTASGVRVTAAGTTANVVKGNLIGLDAAGTTAIANLDHGVSIDTGAPGTIVGGSTSGDRNVISGNGDNGVDVTGNTADGTVIQGNYIGTDITGTLDRGNTLSGVSVVLADDTTIGGSAAGEGNVISGNGVRGIAVAGSTTTGTVIRGNYIGTNAAGSAAIANSAGGIVVQDSGTSVTIGGSGAGDGNLVSGNSGAGIGLTNSASGNSVMGNKIGINAAANAGVPNSTDGIQVHSGSNNNVIGGTVGGSGNTIAFNTDNGVCIVEAGAAATGNAIRGNSIYSNGGLAIDLSPLPTADCTTEAVSANDGGDGDAGPNDLMNFPVISTTNYVQSTRTLTVTGTLDTISPDDDFVDVYAIDVIDDSGNGQGRQWLGSADPNGAGAWTFTSTNGVPLYGYISVTATDTSGNTSEFGETHDADVDGDGFTANLDNCDVVYNPQQMDHDADSVGDACDSVVRNRYTASSSSVTVEFASAPGQEIPEDSRFFNAWDINPGSGIDVGAVVGTIQDTVHLGTTTTPCDMGNFYSVNLVNATTNTGARVDTSSILLDGDADGLVNGAEQFPRFLTTLLDPQKLTNVDDDGDTIIDEDPSGGKTVIDGDIDINNSGGVTAADDGQYLAYSVIDGRLDLTGDDSITAADDGTIASVTIIDGRVDVDNSATITGSDDGDPWRGVNNDGDGRVDEDPIGLLETLHARYFAQIGGGFINVLVFEVTANSLYRSTVIFNDPIGPFFVGTDVCSPTEYKQTLNTNSADNPATTGTTEGVSAVLGSVPAGTHTFTYEALDPPDTDGDGVVNYRDVCPTIMNATQTDADNDKIGDTCEPTSGPCFGSSAVDCDSDGYSNVVDNCPAISNASQMESERRTAGPFGLYRTGDAMGDACDNDPTVVLDVNEVSLRRYAGAICVIGAPHVDADADGWCGGSLFTDPDDGNAARTPEDDAIAMGSCSNGADDDGDTFVDGTDSACADADGDGVPNNVDICDAAADPLQLDADGDLQGDACESDAIADLDLITGTNAANSELRNRLVEVAPGGLHRADGIINFIDPDFVVEAGAAVPNGAIRAALSSNITVGIDPSPGSPTTTTKPCNNVIPVSYTLWDASTNTADQILSTPTFTNLRADTAVVNGLSDGVDKYPSFLTRIPGLAAGVNNDGDFATDEDPVDYVDNDQDGQVDEDGLDHATPMARMFGWANYQGENHVVNVLVYATSALPQFAASKGYSVWIIFDNPTTPSDNGDITSVCSHQDHRLYQYAVSLENSSTGGSEGGTKLIANDSAAVTERFSTQVTALPDLDGDGTENLLDGCPHAADNDHDGTPDQSDASPWNPRLVAPPGDPDLDGLPTGCDRAENLAPASGECTEAIDSDFDGKVNDGCPASGAAESGASCDNAVDNDGDTLVNDGCPALGDPNVPSPPGSGPDEDGDHIENTHDNCDYVDNPDQRDSDYDGIGDLCDLATGVVGSGTQTVSEIGTPQCTNGTDVDQDGYCTDVDPLDTSSTRIPEVSGYSPIICANSVDDDADTFFDTNDPGCEDVDGDGVLNISDNCPGIPPADPDKNVNPLQEDSDGDTGSRVGQQPYARSSNGTPLGDPSSVFGEPYARSDKFGGDACDPDDDADQLPDGYECDTGDNDSDGLVNDGCPQAGAFSEADLPGACLNSIDEADEDPGVGVSNDDLQINDGCPASGPAEGDCRFDDDCDNDVFQDLVEWKSSALNPDVADACLNMHAPAPTTGPQSIRGNFDNDSLFNYGEAVIGFAVCDNSNLQGDFGFDDPDFDPSAVAKCFVTATPMPAPTPTPLVCDGDGYRGAVERYVDDAGLAITTNNPSDTIVGTNPRDPCGVGAIPAPSDGWPSDLASGGIPSSSDRVTITDVTSFIAPIRRLGTSYPDPEYIRRWDLLPGSTFGQWVNIQDLTALISGPSGFPHMFGGAAAFNGPTCNLPPY